MLKRVIVNQKVIPVPVPLKTLAEVCSWVEEILVGPGQTVTSAILDGKDILNFWGQDATASSILVHADACLKLRVESPEDLALQALETIQALAATVLTCLKSLAVHLWQSRFNDRQPELLTVIQDLDLMSELMDRMDEMSCFVPLDLRPLSATVSASRDIKIRLDDAIAKGDWKQAAQVLLRDTLDSVGLESILKKLSFEAESAHQNLIKVISNQGAHLGAQTQ